MRNLMPRAAVAVLAALVLSSLAAAQRGGASPQAIVVNPVPSYKVSVWLDRAPEGIDIPRYEIGEPIRIGVSTDEDAYVYLFSVSSNGDVVQILPNRFSGGRDAFLGAGTTRFFPPVDASYTFTADAPAGLARVVALASHRPLDTGTLASFRSEHDLLATSQLGQEGFAQALSIVVRPLPQDSWVTATAEFYVVDGPRYGLSPRPVAQYLNARLNLAPYPGSVVTRQSESRGDSESTFTADASLGSVYSHLHEQLVAAGWRRSDLERDDDEIEAEYRKGRESFDLELEAEGRGRFVLEIDFD